MSRRKKQLSLEDEQPIFSLSPGAKKAIIVIICLALAAISILSLTNSAGGLGRLLNKIFIYLFGWLKWAAPVLFAGSAYFLASGKPKKYQTWRLIGLAVMILSLLAGVNLFLNQETLVEQIKQGQGGGYLGLAISYPLLKISGFWASLIIAASLFLISLFIIFDGLYLIFNKLKFKKEKKESAEEQSTEDEEEYAEATKQKKGLFNFRKNKENQESAQTEKSSDITVESKEAAAENELTSALHSRLRRQIDLPLNLLDNETEKPNAGNIKNSKERIQKTLANFGIEVEMGPVSVGPTVSQYTLKPAEGIRLSQITALSNDLALALAAHPIRIEAPIPGKSLVGLEVPNEIIATVKLRRILESKEFKDKRKSNLTLGLGRDVSGQVYIADLTGMPHLLIAGATGSGKSVCIHSIITSLLYQNSPDDLKFILVDPKRVELIVYNDIPHLLTPVICDVKKTLNSLRWAIAEMDRRYDLLSGSRQRNIAAYNLKSTEPLPYIIIIIDELADLMAIAAKEVEAVIIRLAQMARAVGIHLILATQRPSVDVITGLIKANITSRVAFAVASQTDSRTILDTGGAEKLLGRGDLLFTSAQLSKPKRIQGAYVSEKEVQKVAAYLKNIAAPDYLEDIAEKQTLDLSFHSNLNGPENLEDDLLPEARDLIIKANKASASYLQRRLRIGYARAARLLDLLEEQGIIGPADGAKPREVLTRDNETLRENDYETHN